METNSQQPQPDQSRFDDIFERQSPFNAEFIKEFNAAQALFQKAAKDKVNEHFGSHYADLAGVMDACMPHLTARGFIVNQSIVYHPGFRQEFLVTKVEHEQGWRQSCVRLSALAKGPQAFGSELTYMRRYCLAALMGIASDDDDGNAATEAHNRDQRQGPGRDKRDRNRGQEQPRQVPAQSSEGTAPRKLNEQEVKMLALAKDLRGYLTGEAATTKAKIDKFFKDPAVIKDLETLQAGSELLYGKLLKQVEEHKAKLPAE